MESKKKQIVAELAAKIEAFDAKIVKKKKKRGWRSSKLDPFSHVLFELRRQGRSLKYMSDFLLDSYKITVHKSTVKRFLDKLELQKQEAKHDESK